MRQFREGRARIPEPGVRGFRLGVRLWLELVLIYGLALCMPAIAEPARPDQEALYREAMESIASGRPEDAGDQLSRMISLEPEHAGAWLDLAIIQCQLGRTAEAERLFQVIELRFDPPPGIREVIRSNRLRGCAGWQPRSRWSLALGRGADSNVNQGASSPNFSIGSGTSRIDLQLLPEYLPHNDQYTLLSVDYLRDLTRNGAAGFAQLRLRKNDSLSRYDTSSLRLGMEQGVQFGDWAIRGTAAVGLLKLGSQLYQRQGQLQARVSVPVPIPEGMQFNLLTGLSRVQYMTLKDYDASTAEFGGLLAYQNHRVQLQASAGHLSDHGRATRLGGDRRGWFAGLQGSLRLPANLLGEAGWTRQRWLAETAYSPGLIDAVRRQDTQLIRAALTIPIKPHHALNIEWRKVINDENISIFQYNSRLVQITWQWQDF